ncbi:hypothetical protein ACFQZ4_25980 [Catellatospora coxensis]
MTAQDAHVCPASPTIMGADPVRRPHMHGLRPTFSLAGAVAR